MPSQLVKDLINQEYERLCKHLGLTPVTIDIYDCDTQAPPSQVTEYGSPIRVSAARYSSKWKHTPRNSILIKIKDYFRRYLDNGNSSFGILALPIDGNDPLPSSLPAFPPPSWARQHPCWEPWRKELWHEVVHQMSDRLGVCSTTEPDRIRVMGDPNPQGHGAGWWLAIVIIAASFNNNPVRPQELEQLLR